MTALWWLLAAFLLVPAASLPAAAAGNYPSPHITIRNDLKGKGAWITAYQDSGYDVITKSYCVGPGDSDSRKVTTAYKVIAEIKEHSNCHGRTVGKLAKDLWSRFFEKTIRESSGTYSW